MSMEKFLKNLGIPAPIFDNSLTEQEIQQKEAGLERRAQLIGPKIWQLIDTYGDSGIRLGGPSSRFRGSKLIHLGELDSPVTNGRSDSFITLSAFMIRGRFKDIRMVYFTARPDESDAMEYPSELNASFKWPRWGNGDDRDINHIETVVDSLVHSIGSE